MSKVKKCLECKKVVIGRSDKKYCDDYCRSEYNNRLNSETSNYMRRVNSILKKNRRVLAKLSQTKLPKYPKERLINEGFNFYYFTNKFKSNSGKEYYFCYEHGILELENNWCLLVQSRDQVDPL